MDSIVIPVGTDTTFAFVSDGDVIWFDNDVWSVEVNSVNAGGVDTLYCYCTGDPDSTVTAYPLIWADLDLDGANDNPWTLSQTTNLLFWGDEWPCRYIILKLLKGTGTAGNRHYLRLTKSGRR